MSLSLNETHKIVKDAARGSGMSWGEADELAHAAVWLEVAGLPGLTAAAGVLDDYANQRSSDLHLTATDGWTLTPQTSDNIDILCALKAAITARDLLTVQSCDKELRINSVTRPLVPVAVLSAAAIKQAHNIEVTVKTGRGETATRVWVIDATVHMQDDALTAAPLMNMTARIVPSASPPPSGTEIIWSRDRHNGALNAGLSPSESARKTLEALADNCLVPATEESRLKGAGAGTVDRD